jgi:HlyD family secretion protein
LKSPHELLTQLHVWEGKVIAAQGDVKRAEATLAGIQSQIEIAQQDQSNIGKTRLAMLQRQRESAQANLLAAQTTLSGTQRVVELYRQMLAQPLELIAAQHAAAFQVQVAEAGLNVAQAELAIAQRGPQKEAVALAEAKLRAARASLEIVQAQLNRAKITSPMDAQVVGRNVEPGETVRPGVPLIVLADPRELEMTIYVPIRSMGTLKVGQTGTLRLPSIPGKSFTAKVTYIAPEAEFKPANIYNSQERSEMVFAVRVTIPNPSGELKAGLPADVTFQ